VLDRSSRTPTTCNNHTPTNALAQSCLGGRPERGDVGVDRDAAGDGQRCRSLGSVSHNCLRLRV
jgi:hypothetical protein